MKTNDSTFQQVMKQLTLEPLSSEQLLTIDGGESGWYWISYYGTKFSMAVHSGVSHYSAHRMEFGK